MEEKKRASLNQVLPKEGDKFGNYEVESLVGAGNYGTVFRGFHLKTHEIVAMKFINVPKTKRDVIMLEREVKIAKKLKHPNVVQLLEVIEPTERITLTCLVMEFINGCDFFELLREKFYLSEDEARMVFKQMVKGVAYCHQNSVTHRDLKLENILINEDGQVKIVDFGLANFMEDGEMLSTFCGSPLYAAPEMLLGSKYIGPSVDVWSLGVILYMIVTGVIPWEGRTEQQQAKNSIKGQFELPCDLSEELQDLIKSMLTVDSEQRATIQDILLHPWMKGEDDLDSLCTGMADMEVHSKKTTRNDSLH